MGLCLYVDLCFHASSLPCLHTFWHAIPTSSYIFNVFYFLLYLLVLVPLCYVVNCQSPLHSTSAPGTPPENVQVTAQDSSSVVVSWQEPTEPNGRITHYTVYVNGSADGSMTSGPVLTHIISGLSPAQLVRVRVSASTLAGEGPQSNETAGMSRDGSKHHLVIAKHLSTIIAVYRWFSVWLVAALAFSLFHMVNDR